MSLGRTNGRWLVAVGLVVAVVLVWVLSPIASDDPDGLEQVSATHGLESEVGPHDLEASPVADYRVRGMENEALGSGISAIVGIVVTFLVGLAVAGGMVWRTRRGGTGTRSSTADPGDRSPKSHDEREGGDSPATVT